MSTSIVRVQNAGSLTKERLEIEKTIAQDVLPPRAQNTKRAHRTEWAAFEAWCAQERLQSCPAAVRTISMYAEHMKRAGRRVKGVELALSVISSTHMDRGFASPVRTTIVANTMKRIRREIGTAVKKKKALLLKDMRLLLRSIPSDLPGLRDRALLAIGFLGGFRRSELAAVRLEHIERFERSIRILIPKSKTNQEGKRKYKTIPIGEATRMLDRWLAAAGIGEGPVFRAVDQWGHVSDKALCGKTVALIVKRACAAAGLDTAEFSGHSLRSGLVSQAKMDKKTTSAIMAQTGHTKSSSVDDYDQHEPDVEDCVAYGMEFDLEDES